MDDDRAVYLALALAPGMGPARMRTLLDACGTPLRALAAPLQLVSGLEGFSRPMAAAIKAVTPAHGRALLDQVAKLGARVLLPLDREYPALLHTLADPPTVLFAQGDLSLLQRPAVALVGSRDHSSYGAEVCRLLGTHLARAGVVVVSGMARGLDAVAHRAALDAGGGTIGVLGNGLGVIYPAANRRLYEDVAARGLLLTEFPPGERPHAGSFPRRNRLISGLARVTVIVEAAAGSGALITANCGLEQGREVMAVPGPITSPVSLGTNALIRDGAAPVLEPADVLRHYPELPPVELLPTDRAAAALQPLPDDLSPEVRDLALQLGTEAMPIDALSLRVGKPVREVLAALSTLEIAGVVEQQPGRVFKRR